MPKGHFKTFNIVSRFVLQKKKAAKKKNNRGFLLQQISKTDTCMHQARGAIIYQPGWYKGGGEGGG